MTSISRESTSMLSRVAPFAIGLLTLACGGDDGSPPLAPDSETDGPTSTTGSDDTTVDPSGQDDSSSGFVPLCQPDERRCRADGTAIEICAGTGLEWVEELACGTYSECQPCEEGDDQCTVPTCVGPCQLTENDPSSAGCAFVVNRSLHPFQDFADGLVVTNPNEELSAAVQIFEVPEGVLDEQLFESFNLSPGESRTLELTTDFVPGTGSNLRTGGIFRVYSDVPVIGYQHAPLRSNRGNESALLLPDRVLGNDYVVMAYSSLDTSIRGASYFELVALEDDTTVSWTPPSDTAGNGLPIDPVAAGEQGTLVLNRYETMRIVPSQLGIPDDDPDAFEALDISGTVVHSDKPVWISGGNRFSRVPLGTPGQGGTGDQLFEVLFPLQHWGRKYVLPAAVPRTWEFDPPPQVADWADFVEENHYRIYSGGTGVTVTSDPPHPEFPITLDNIGDFVDIVTEAGVNLTVEASGPYMPVQYIRSRLFNFDGVSGPPQTGYGDAAMVQLVPTEQYLSRYVFATGVDFYYNHVQIIRSTTEDEVQITSEAGNIIRACNQADCDVQFVSAGTDAEVAVVNIEPGTYTAESDTPFAIIQSGSARGVGNGDDGMPLDAQCEASTPDDPLCFSTYAYPGGMKAEAIFIP